MHGTGATLSTMVSHSMGALRTGLVSPSCIDRGDDNRVHPVEIGFGASDNVTGKEADTFTRDSSDLVRRRDQLVSTLDDGSALGAGSPKRPNGGQSLWAAAKNYRPRDVEGAVAVGEAVGAREHP